jgi:hypothetical protein
MSDKDHPVWDVYDLLRTARLNVKYYSYRLSEIEAQNFILELIILCSAPTSAIAGLWFWETLPGEIIWKIFGVIAAFVAILKPLLSLTKKIKEFDGVLSGYKGLEHDLMEIKVMITQKQKYDQAAQTEFKKALKRKGVLVGKDPETKQNSKIKSKYEIEVMQELPSNSFFIPKS